MYLDLEWENSNGPAAPGVYFAVLLLLFLEQIDPYQGQTQVIEDMGNYRAQRKSFHSRVQIHCGPDSL